MTSRTIFLSVCLAVALAFSAAVRADDITCSQLDECEPCYPRRLGWDGPQDITFSAAAEAIFLDRSGAASHTVFTDLVNSSEAFNIRDLGWNYEFGPRITLGANRCDGWGVEASWFLIDGWDSAASVTGGLGQFQENFAGFNFGDIQEFRVSYASELQNAEVNLRRQMDGWLTLLAGVRWVELNETATVFADEIVLPNQDEVTTNTTNDLVGFQLGAIASLWSRGERLQLDAIAKAGIYGVNADQTTIDVLGTENAPGFAVSAGRNGAAFVGEFGLNAVAMVTKHLSVQAGYNVFLLTGLALAPDQWDNTDLTIPVANIDTQGTLVAHGGTVGFVLCR